MGRGGCSLVRNPQASGCQSRPSSSWVSHWWDGLCLDLWQRGMDVTGDSRQSGRWTQCPWTSLLSHFRPRSQPSSSYWPGASLRGHQLGKWALHKYVFVHVLSQHPVHSDTRVAVWGCASPHPSSGSRGFLPMLPAHNSIMAARLWLKGSLGPSLVACLLSLQPHPPLHSRIPSLFLLLSCSFLIRLHLSPWRGMFLSCTLMFFKGTLMKRSLS